MTAVTIPATGPVKSECQGRAPVSMFVGAAIKPAIGLVIAPTKPCAVLRTPVNWLRAVCNSVRSF